MRRNSYPPYFWAILLVAVLFAAGIPTALVGVLQINYQVPSGVTPGVQPVVVTVGSASSTEASGIPEPTVATTVVPCSTTAQLDANSVCTQSTSRHHSAA